MSRFNPDVAWSVTDYGRSFHLAPILLSGAGEVQVDVLFFGPGDHIRRHPVALPQLICVIHGPDRVRSDPDEPSPIAPARAAFWWLGEDHEAGRDAGLTAVVVEVEALDPDAVLSPL